MTVYKRFKAAPNPFTAIKTGLFMRRAYFNHTAHLRERDYS